MIAAGLDGIGAQRTPGPRRDNNMYTEPLPASEVRRLPANLLDALRALRSNELLVASLGSSFVDAYCKLSEHAWHEHNAQISPWERQRTLDC